MLTPPAPRPSDSPRQTPSPVSTDGESSGIAESPPPALTPSSGLQRAFSFFSGAFRTKASAQRSQLLQICSTKPGFKEKKSRLKATFDNLTLEELTLLQKILETATDPVAFDILSTLSASPAFAKQVLNIPYLEPKLMEQALRIQDLTAQDQVLLAHDLLCSSSQEMKLYAHLNLIHIPAHPEAKSLIDFAFAQASELDQGLHLTIKRLSQQQAVDLIQAFPNRSNTKALAQALIRLDASLQFANSLNHELCLHQLHTSNLEQLSNTFMQSTEIRQLVQVCLDTFNRFRHNPDHGRDLLASSEQQPSQFDAALLQLHAHAPSLPSQQVPSFLKLLEFIDRAAGMGKISQLKTTDKLAEAINAKFFKTEQDGEALKIALSQDPDFAKLVRTCFENLLIFESQDTIAQGALFDITDANSSVFEQSLLQLQMYLATHPSPSSSLFTDLVGRLDRASEMGLISQLLHTSHVLQEHLRVYPQEGIQGVLLAAKTTAKIRERFHGQLAKEQEERLLQLLLDNPQTAQELLDHCQLFDRYLAINNPEQSRNLTALEIKARHDLAIQEGFEKLQQDLLRHAPYLHDQYKEKSAGALQSFLETGDVTSIKLLLNELQQASLVQESELIHDLESLIEKVNLLPEIFTPRADSNEDSEFLRNIYLEYRERAVVSNMQIVEEALGRYCCDLAMPFETIPDQEELRGLLGITRIPLARCVPSIQGNSSFGLSSQISPDPAVQHLSITLTEPNGASKICTIDLPPNIAPVDLYNALLTGTDTLEAQGNVSAEFIEGIKRWALRAEKSLQEARQILQHSEDLPAAQSKEEFLSQIQEGSIYVRPSTHFLALTPRAPSHIPDCSTLAPELLQRVEQQLSPATATSAHHSVQAQLPTLDGELIPFTLELDTAHHEQHHEFYRLSTHFVFHGKAISQVSYLPVSKWANNELVRDSDEEIAGKLKSRHFIETHLLNLQAKILKG